MLPIYVFISAFTGQFPLDIDECKSQPCQHGGTCFDGMYSYTCQCMDGFIGKNCEIGEYWLIHLVNVHNSGENGKVKRTSSLQWGKRGD